MAADPSQLKRINHPVDMVSWDDAQEFCKAVAQLSRLRYTIRLPTEAEWEFACRAGTNTTYNTGDNEAALDKAAWYIANSRNTTHPVGQKAANAWGVYDMHGNVWEWCADWYAPYTAGAVNDPRGPTEGQYRVLRGGAWGIGTWGCRSALRYWDISVGRGGGVGFRVVVFVAPTTP
jgi:formylglycine-generating enzyme required for sulfatase activity